MTPDLDLGRALLIWGFILQIATGGIYIGLFIAFMREIRRRLKFLEDQAVMRGEYLAHREAVATDVRDLQTDLRDLRRTTEGRRRA